MSAAQERNFPGRDLAAQWSHSAVREFARPYLSAYLAWCINAYRRVRLRMSARFADRVRIYQEPRLREDTSYADRPTTVRYDRARASLD